MPAHQPVRLTALAEGPGTLRVQVDGPGQVRHRLLMPAHQPVHLAPPAEGPGTLRVQADGPGQVRHRLLMPAHQPVRAAALGEGRDVLRMSSYPRRLSGPSASCRSVVTRKSLTWVHGPGRPSWMWRSTGVPSVSSRNLPCLKVPQLREIHLHHAATVSCGMHATVKDAGCTRTPAERPDDATAPLASASSRSRAGIMVYISLAAVPNDPSVLLRDERVSALCEPRRIGHIHVPPGKFRPFFRSRRRVRKAGGPGDPGFPGKPILPMPP